SQSAVGFEQDLWRLRTTLVAGGEGRGVGVGVSDNDKSASRGQRKAMPLECVCGVTDWSLHIRRQGVLGSGGGADVNGMARAVSSRANQLGHSRINDDLLPAAPTVNVEHTRQYPARTGDQIATRFDRRP